MLSDVHDPETICHILIEEVLSRLDYYLVESVEDIFHFDFLPDSISA